MPSINSSSPSVAHIVVSINEPLLAAASTSVPKLTSYAETETAGQAAHVTNAHSLASGATMRKRLLNAAMGGIHGTIDVSLAGYNNLIKPAGSVVMNTSFATLKNIVTFVQESVTGVAFVEGHAVSGRADSVLRLPQRLIAPSIKELFTDDGTGLSEKSLAFLKKVGTSAGGMAASFIYQMAIVTVSDTVGRVCAEKAVDDLEEGNFALPLAATGALALYAVAKGKSFLDNMRHFNALRPEQQSLVIAAHYGITPEAFNAKPDTEREKLEAKLTRDWLILAGAAALMPTGAFSMNLIAAVSPITAFANPLFMTIAKNLTKVAVRSPGYGGLRETLQEVFTGPKGGVADLTHAEAGWLGLKFGGMSAAVNMGQDAAKQAIVKNNWGGTISILTANSVVNAVGESLNWADSTSDRTKKCAELAKKALIEQHEEYEMPPPTPAELKAVAEQAEFAFNLGIKDQSFAEALRNIGRRQAGSEFVREGVYAFSNAISTIVPILLGKIEAAIGGKGSHDVLNNLILGFTTIFTYIKFNASSQSLGALRSILAHNEKEAARNSLPSDEDLLNALDDQEGSSRGQNIVRSGSIHVDNPVTESTDSISGLGRRSYSENLHEAGRATRGLTKRADSRGMSDFS